jgi:hypothetical protein
LLRATVEAFAGVLGGCDSMQVGAFDEVVRPPDDFSRRIARNTQLVLQKECALNHVVDPAGGSWYVESATAEIATRAWTLFQEVEKLGGMEAALRAGVPQQGGRRNRAQENQSGDGSARFHRGRQSIRQSQGKAARRGGGGCQSISQTAHATSGSHRTSLDDADSQAVLDWLAKIIGLKGTRFV